MIIIQNKTVSRERQREENYVQQIEQARRAGREQELTGWLKINCCSIQN